MSPYQNTPEYLRNGGVLSNGYKLQHYKYLRNPSMEHIDAALDWLYNATDQDFNNRAQQMRQMMADPRMRRYQYALATIGTGRFEAAMGLPSQPDVYSLVATGDRPHAIATIEDYLQRLHAAKESMDSGGLKMERQHELMDRRYAEEKKKRREKRERGCCVM